MIVLSKTFSREFSLFDCYIWNAAETKYQREWLGCNVGHILFLKKDRTNVVSAWYAEGDIDKRRNAMQRKVNRDSRYFLRVKKADVFYSDLIRPYVEEDREIESLEELRTFYVNWIDWWTTMSIIFLLVDTKGIPYRVRKEVLRLRTKTQEYADICNKAFLSFFQKQYPQYQRLSFVVTPQEVFSLEKKGRFDVRELTTIKRRLGGYALLDGELLSTNDLSRKLKAKKLVLERPVTKATAKAVSRLKGLAASRGVATGRVKLILYEKGISKLKKGEVLVTTMTSPMFVPAMRKAAAIVTDEGGIACHAAIVARELKKPCVIGTKIATQVLRDGDHVEVDAERGVVKILKR